MTLFTQKIQEAIGEVGPETAGAKQMLTKIGFRYDERIDPFDGGPHYSAATREIEPIRRYRRARLSEEELPADAEPTPGEVEFRLVALERAHGRNRFRALRALCGFRDADVRLAPVVRDTLGARPGDRLQTIPFD